MLKIKKNNFIDGKEIYHLVEVKSNYRNWVLRCIDYADLKQDKDFRQFLGESTGGRPKKIYEFTIDAAKEMCIVSGTKKAKELRRWLINLSNKHESGLAFTSEQILALIDLSKSMILVSIQKEVEKKHYALYDNPYNWYQYRANLLGYSKETLVLAMNAINKKYKSIRKSLIKLDANELIRAGVIDFFVALGKSKEYAVNAANLCKDMAEKMNLGANIWDDTKQNSLGINKPEHSKLKSNFKALENE
jgi:phage anti-repressor protein